MIITDMEVRSKRLSNANLPSTHEEPITPDENSTYGVRPGLLAELLKRRVVVEFGADFRERQGKSGDEPL
jgi:hypothetical protein